MPSPKRAAIYCRISQDRKGEALNVQAQERNCRAYAEAHGLEVQHVLVDNNISGFKRSSRAGWEELQRLVRDREIDALISWKNDRLGRNQLEFWTLADAAESKTSRDPGVEIHLSEDGGLLDLESASGGLTAGMMVTVARFESATKRDRAHAKARDKLKRGEYLGGTRPFGWTVEGTQLVLNEAEAVALREAVQDLLLGRSLGSIIRAWNDPDRPGGPMLTTLGKPWTYTTLRQALLRDRNTGRFTVTVGKGKGRTTHVAECPAIISEDDHAAVQRLLTDKSRRRSQSNKARHLLAGIAQCHCGELVKSATTLGRPNKVTGERPARLVYRCPAKGPGHVGKGIEYVDTVAELFVYALLAQDAQEQQRDPRRVEELRQLEGEWTTLKRRRDQAGQAFAEGVMDLGQLAAFNRSIDSQLEAIDRERAALGAASVVELGDTSEVLRSFERDDSAFREWRRSPVDDRRDFVRARLHVVLMPHAGGSARAFDTWTVRVYPRTLLERGQSLSAEEVAARPPTPLVSAAKINSDAAESWTEYLSEFMWRSGAGWPDVLEASPYRDTRASFKPHWQPLEAASDDSEEISRG